MDKQNGSWPSHCPTHSICIVSCLSIVFWVMDQHWKFNRINLQLTRVVSTIVHFIYDFIGYLRQANDIKLHVHPSVCIKNCWENTVQFYVVRYQTICTMLTSKLINIAARQCMQILCSEKLWTDLVARGGMRWGFPAEEFGEQRKKERKKDRQGKYRNWLVLGRRSERNCVKEVLTSGGLETENCGCWPSTFDVGSSSMRNSTMALE